jgi:hypothetical protein
MKTAFALLVSLCTLSTSIAQKKLSSFDQVEMEDLTMTSCEIDPTAEAYKLLDIADVTFERGRHLFKMNMERRVRIKILKDKGVELANVRIPFYSNLNYQRIADISGVTYNVGADGKVVKSKLSKDAIYTQKVNKRWSTITFRMPDVKVGSIIEYRYADIKESFSRLEDWVFQDDIPTRYSYYRARVPSFFKYVSQLYVYQPVERTREERAEKMSTGDGILDYTSVEVSFAMSKIKALKNEPYMSSFKDYQQRIEFQLSQIDYGNGNITDYRTTWPKLSKELMEDEDFGQQINRNLPGTRDLEERLKQIQDDYQRMLAIHNYVKSNMTWNGHESIWSTDGVRQAWDKKTGTSGDINLILLNLLKQYGVKATPMLVSTRDHGETNTLYPFLGQFNGVMAYVEIGDDFYVLNGADKYNPARLIPYDVINTEAFLVSKDNSRWVDLANAKQKWRAVVWLLAGIDNGGTFKGEAVVYNYDYSRNPKTKKYKEDRDHFNEFFASGTSGVKIEQVAVMNVDNDSLPLEQKVNFTSTLSTSGEYKYFNLNMFTGLDKNPFIEDDRNTDVNFGYNQSYTIYGSVDIPTDYKIEELPKNILMIMPDTSITFRRFLQLDENTLSFRITVDFAKPFYNVQEYPSFKEFNKKLYAKLNEQIVIKKKNTIP